MGSRQTKEAKAAVAEVAKTLEANDEQKCECEKCSCSPCKCGERIEDKPMDAGPEKGKTPASAAQYATAMKVGEKVFEEVKKLAAKEENKLATSEAKATPNCKCGPECKCDPCTCAVGCTCNPCICNPCKGGVSEEKEQQPAEAEVKDSAEAEVKAEVAGEGEKTHDAEKSKEGEGSGTESVKEEEAPEKLREKILAPVSPAKETSGVVADEEHVVSPNALTDDQTVATQD